jgi:hypothetical protein
MITAMEKSLKNKPASGFSSSSKDDQLAALKEWEDRTGLHSSSASIILGTLGKPLTKEGFLEMDDPGMDVLDALEDPDYLEALPEWFADLPTEED